MAKKLPPIPPGEILLEEFMKPVSLTRQKLAADLDIPVSRIAEIVRGERAITADTALRLGEYFGNSARFWLNLQTTYDLQLAEDEAWDQKKARIRPLNVAAATT
jgi:addiction module HigA family antidote